MDTQQDNQAGVFAHLRAALNRGQTDEDINNLLPLFVPESFVSSGHWPGPHQTLSNEELVLTWTVIHLDQTMVYVNHERAALWEKEGIDWKGRAINNLRAMSGSPVWTHEKQREDDSLVMVGLMHEDGLGPSRILLNQELGEAFPGGYRVAIPERSCGIVIAADLAPSELEQMVELIQACYRGGSNPMTPSLFEPGQLNPST